MIGFLGTTLGRYLLWRSAAGFGVAMAAVVASILLIDIVEQLRTLGDRVELSLGFAAYLSLLKTPQLIEQTMPMIVLAGAMIAVIGLNRRSELIAMRASGVSAWRFLTPAVALAGVLGVLVVLALNPLGAALYQRFEAEKARLLSDNEEAPMPNGFWIRQGAPGGQIVLHAERWDRSDGVSGRLRDVTLFHFAARDGALRFVRRTHADSAELRGGFWQLTDVVEAAPGVAPTRERQIAIPTNLDASELLDRFVAPATLSFWQLPSFLSEADEAGLAPVRYELRWQGLLAYPLLLMAMAALGAVFSLRLQRLGGFAEWCALGAAIGVFLFFFGQLSAAFAVARAAPALVAAWSPPLAGVFVALAFVAYLEDG